MEPLVSVIIPTYNYAHYIGEAIDSVLKQNYPVDKIEIVIVDDGSTDNTKDVLKPYINAGKVKYYYQSNTGKASATYSAIQKSNGKYIFNLDADDYFFPEKIPLSVEIFEADEGIVHVANPAKFVIDGADAGKEEIPVEYLGKKLNGINLLRYFYNNRTLFGGGSTFAARASALKPVFIPAAVDMYIDEFLVLAILTKGYTFFIQEPQSIWRGHNTNYTVTQTNIIKKNKRLADSSKGILDAILSDEYPQEIQKLYALHHHTRYLFFEEAANKKSIGDIWRFMVFCFFKNRYTLKQLRTYSAFNRLLPNLVIRILKKDKK
jgi:glycosyltransferase involved in cell wall biosynthesis